MIKLQQQIECEGSRWRQTAVANGDSYGDADGLWWCWRWWAKEVSAIRFDYW